MRERRKKFGEAKTYGDAKEDAAKEAAPIFVTAIKGLTFQDATNILMGTDNAATSFLNRTTSQPLYDKFKPKIVSSLDKIGANDLWIAASTIHVRAQLVTADRLFTDVPGLDLLA